MLAQSSFWLNLTNRRAWARLRGECPCLFYLPGLMVGQLSAYWLGCGAAALWLVWLLYLRRAALSPKRPLPVHLLSSGVGILSMLAVLPGPLPAAMDGGQHLEVWIDAPPRYRRPGEVEFSARVGKHLNPSAGDEADLQGRRLLCRAVDLPWRNIALMTEGAGLVLRAEIHRLRRPLNPFAYDATLIRHGYSAVGRAVYAGRPHAAGASVWAGWKESLIRTTRGVLGDNEQSGLWLSMGLGVRDVLSDRTERAFKRTGLSHLLVFSGYQVTLVYYFFFGILRWVLVRWHWLASRIYVPWLAQTVSLCLGLMLVMLTGIEGSSLRAALAIMFVVVAHGLERGGGMLNAIAGSLLAMGVIWPGSYCEPGIELTYAALAGLCLGLGRPGGMGRYLAACALASFFTAGVSLWWFDQLSLIGFLLNPVAAPLAGLVSCKGGFLALGLHLAGIDPSGFCLKAVVGVLAWFRSAVLEIGGWEYAALELSGAGKTAVLAVFCLLSMRWLWRRYLDYLLEQNLYRER